MHRTPGISLLVIWPEPILMPGLSHGAIPHILQGPDWAGNNFGIEHRDRLIGSGGVSRIESSGFVLKTDGLNMEIWRYELERAGPKWAKIEFAC